MAPLGERIRQARQLNALNQRRLAEMVGVSHNAISKYEKEEDIPSSGVLLRLAKALDVSLDYFFREPSVELGDPRFRHSKGRFLKKEEKKLLADIREWLERYGELEQIFERKSSNAFVLPEGFPHSVSSLDRAEKRAEELRRLWDLGSDPIPDMVELLEGKGIRVFQVERDDSFESLVVPVSNEPGDEYVIVVNSSFSGDHQRLSLAHELGHMMLKPSKSTAVNEEEMAFRFGAAFIVPRQAAIEELGEHRTQLGIEELHSLKHKYGLSMQAWIRRAAELGIIRSAEPLLSEFERNGWKEREPGDQYPVEKPRRMQRLVFRALAEGLITHSRAEELLGRLISRDSRDLVRAGQSDGN